jgi:hypothetical protein
MHSVGSGLETLPRYFIEGRCGVCLRVDEVLDGAGDGAAALAAVELLEEGAVAVHSHDARRLQLRLEEALRGVEFSAMVRRLRRMTGVLIAYYNTRI